MNAGVEDRNTIKHDDDDDEPQQEDAPFITCLESR